MRTMTLAVAVLSIFALGAAVTSCSTESYAQAEIKLPTIQCANCVTNVTTALEKVDGVKEANVDLDRKVATVSYAEGTTTVALMEQAVVKAGYAANDKKADGEAYAELPMCCKVKEE